jgi:hypothetical protein
MIETLNFLQVKSDEISSLKADLLFNELTEDLPNGNTADYVILAVQSLEQAATFLRLAKRNL